MDRTHNLEVEKDFSINETGSKTMRSILFLSLFLISTLFGLLIYKDVKAAVDLASFTATVQETSILIEWETATEFDNAGFFVKRNTSSSPPWTDISGFITAEGSGVIGAEYQFVDDNVASGVYYYILEAVDISQQIEIHGPISVTFNAQLTNTPTLESTPTINPTSTPKTKTATSTNVPTITETHTPIPSKTVTSAPPTLTHTPFTDTPTPTRTPSITPSPTLIDAPEIVVVLPATKTPISTIATITPLPIPTPTNKGMFSQMVESGSLMMISVICLVILIWSAIAVTIFIYVQKRNS